MGINCMFQCLTLILSQSPLGQVSSWRICVCYSKHNLKGNDFSYKRDSGPLNINALFIVREWAASKKKNSFMSWRINYSEVYLIKYRGKNQYVLIPLSESSLPVNEGTHCFCLESCILREKLFPSPKGKLLSYWGFLNDTVLSQQHTLLDNWPNLTVYYNKSKLQKID